MPTDLITSATIHTVSGRQVAPLRPDPADIVIEDIAHALSLLCRFGGHTASFYSVAQHSVLVSYLCEPEDALAGLLHDASEAYLADVIRPVKHLPAMDPYRSVEAQLQAVIYRRFGLSALMPDSVYRADELMLAAEAHALLPVLPAWVEGRPVPKLRAPIVPLSPTQAKERFLLRFQLLGGQVGSG